LKKARSGRKRYELYARLWALCVGLKLRWDPVNRNEKDRFKIVGIDVKRVYEI